MSKIYSYHNKNQLIYNLFSRREFSDCMNIIEIELKSNNNNLVFLNFVKALILQRQGQLNESLNLLKSCYLINSKNIDLIKHISGILYMMGKYKSSLDLSKQAIAMNSGDWEVHYNMGLNYQCLNDVNNAIESFKEALSFSKSDKIFVQLGKIFTQQDKLVDAINIYKQALKYSIQNNHIMTVIGILYLRLSQNQEAFLYFGNALSYNQKDTEGILALGSILQDSKEYDMALSKYRVAIQRNPNSRQLWNNIGMCYYGKNNYLAAISCLKRALYLDPFEWILSYNLGLIYIRLNQYTSSFHFFSMAINLNPQYTNAFMYMGISLNNMGDTVNAKKAFDRAIQLEEQKFQVGKQKDFMIYLNYAIVLARQQQDREKAKEYYQEFLKLHNNSDINDDFLTRSNQFEIIKQKELLQRIFYAE